MHKRTHSLLVVVLAIFAVVAGCSRSEVSEQSAESGHPSEPAAAVADDPTPTLAAGDAVAGTIESFDADNGSLAIRADSGERHVGKVELDTAVHSIAEGGREIGKGAKHLGVAVSGGAIQGAHVVAHYTKEGAQTTFHALHVAQKDTVKTTTALIEKIDEKAQSVAVRTASGATEVYHVSKSALVKGAKGTAHFGDQLGHEVMEGSRVVLHHTEQGGQKMVHFIHHLGPESTSESGS